MQKGKLQWSAMEEETKQSLLKMIGEDPSFLGIIIGLLFILYLVAQFSNPIIDFLQKLGRWAKNVGGHEIDVVTIERACALIIKYG